jgi:hypothetical protein
MALAGESKRPDRVHPNDNPDCEASRIRGFFLLIFLPKECAPNP